MRVSHTTPVALRAGLLALAASVLGSPATAQELVWIEGRVTLPDGLPEGEEVSVVSYGRSRETVGHDGLYRIAVPAVLARGGLLDGIPAARGG